MLPDDPKLRAPYYRLLALQCGEPVIRLLLEDCARQYEAQFGRRRPHPAFAPAAGFH